jgi:hypothetical protein
MKNQMTVLETELMQWMFANAKLRSVGKEKERRARVYNTSWDTRLVFLCSQSTSTTTLSHIQSILWIWGHQNSVHSVWTLVQKKREELLDDEITFSREQYERRAAHSIREQVCVVSCRSHMVDGVALSHSLTKMVVMISV